MSDSLLSKENLHYRDLARQIAEEHVRPVAAEYDVKQEYPWPVTKVMAEAGLLGVWIPEEYGGAGGETPVLNLCLMRLKRSATWLGLTVASTSSRNRSISWEPDRNRAVARPRKKLSRQYAAPAPLPPTPAIRYPAGT